MYGCSVTRKQLQLRDGRLLEYVVSGNPAWDLLVLHLGTPLAAVDFPHVNAAAAARNLRTVIYSRPGYGGSTRHRLRTVADAARDTAELADHLDAECFFVAGWSGGGPVALACANLLPDRVRACITLASIAPPVEAGDAWTELYAPEVQEQRRALLTKGPEVLLPEYEEASRPFAEMTVEAMLESPMTNAADSAALRAVRAAAESMVQAFRLGAAGLWGWIDDDWAWVRPWGFLAADIRVPVIVRHGKDDLFVPVKQARWLAEHVPDAHLQELPGSGHGAVAIPFEPVVEALLDAAD